MEFGDVEEEGAGWQEPPASLCSGALRAAVRIELESRGLRAQSLPGAQLPAGKPPRPSQTSSSSCFGVPLGAPQPQLLLESQDGCGQGVWLPRVFVECVRVLRENTQCPGIFRKAGSIARQRTMRTSLEVGQRLMAPNIHDVASILKQYLRELPSPLLPSSLSPALEGAWSRGEGKERLEGVMCALLQLPSSHMQVLREVVHLLHSVAIAECSSLMDSQSLAVVMTPNLMPTQHFDPALLDAVLKTNTGIVQLLIDHAHLVGLAPPDLLNHAHQLAEEGVLTSRSNDSLEGVLLDEIKGEAKRDKQRRGSVTDRVLGWGSKLMSSIGGGSRDIDHAPSPGSRQGGGGHQLEDFAGAEKRSVLFDPSLPSPSLTPKTPRSHKRRRSFLGRRRHTEGRHANGHRPLFSNPFRGASRQAAGRCSDRRFPWLQSNTPSTPGHDVQLVGFEFKSSLNGDGAVMNGQVSVDNGVSTSNQHVLSNQPIQTPVIGNNVLLASVSEESIPAVTAAGEGEGGVRAPKTYAVSRKQSGKRMRCELGGEGEEERAVKRRHTIYHSSRQGHAQLPGIRASKSETTLRQEPSLPAPAFSFSDPTPPRAAQCNLISVPMATDTVSTATDVVSSATDASTVANRPFTFSNPRKYPHRARVVTNSNDSGSCGASVTRATETKRREWSVVDASPIPHLPEVPLGRPRLGKRGSSAFSIPPSPLPPHTLPSQLNEGFLLTPFHAPSRRSPSDSPNLLEKISSELVERHRYSLTTPLATPTFLAAKEAGLAMNDSYMNAVQIRENPDKPDALPLAKPVTLEFDTSIGSDDEPPPGSKVIQEVSLTFELNPHKSSQLPCSCHSNSSHCGCHSNKATGNDSPCAAHQSPLAPPPLPLQPSMRTTNTILLRPPKAPLQRKFALTPLLPQTLKFTDISSPFTTASSRPGKKTPKPNRRGQMYVIPSHGNLSNHGDKENASGGVHVREWIV